MARQPEWHGTHNGRRVHIPDEVIDRHRDCHTDWNWWEDVQDYIKDDVKKILDIDEVNFEEDYGWRAAFEGTFVRDLTFMQLRGELGYRPGESELLWEFIEKHVPDVGELDIVFSNSAYRGIA